MKERTKILIGYDGSECADAFWPSALLTGGVFFAIGPVKSRWSATPWWRSGLSTLLVGGIAASLASAVGLMLRSLVA